MSSFAAEPGLMRSSLCLCQLTGMKCFRAKVLMIHLGSFRGTHDTPCRTVNFGNVIGILNECANTPSGDTQRGIDGF